MKRVKYDAAVFPPIHPDAPVLQDRLYSVHLGNGRKLLFGAERDAAACAAKTSRWLTTHLYDLNDLLVTSFGAVRSVWPVRGINEHDRVRGLAVKLSRRIIQAWDCLDRAAEATGPEQYQIAWQHLGNVCSAIGDIAADLSEHHKKYSPVDRHRMDLLYRRAHAIQTDLAAYGSGWHSAAAIREP